MSSLLARAKKLANNLRSANYKIHIENAHSEEDKQEIRGRYELNDDGLTTEIVIILKKYEWKK